MVAYNDDTGLGRMAQDARAVLGVRHLVAPSQRLTTHPLRAGRDTLLRPDASPDEVAAALEGLDGLVLLEKPDWHPQLVSLAKARGLRLVCVPMWEWFRGRDAHWSQVDRILCPSSFCEQIVRSYGWQHTAPITWSLDLARLPARQISGHARVFVHNAGIVDDDDRKGTHAAIRAFRRLPDRDLRLIVRLQKPTELPAGDSRVEVRLGNVAEPAELYAEGEVAVQPSKMEGLGFMVLEPVCCGLPTLTTDYPPMKEFVAQPEMRARARWFKRSAFPARAAGITHAHLRLPDERALARRLAWCAQHDLGAISRANRTWAETTFAPAHLRELWRRALK